MPPRPLAALCAAVADLRPADPRHDHRERGCRRGGRGRERRGRGCRLGRGGEPGRRGRRGGSSARLLRARRRRRPAHPWALDLVRDADDDALLELVDGLVGHRSGHPGGGARRVRVASRSSGRPMAGRAARGPARRRQRHGGGDGRGDGRRRAPGWPRFPRMRSSRFVGSTTCSWSPGRRTCWRCASGPGRRDVDAPAARAGQHRGRPGAARRPRSRSPAVTSWRTPRRPRSAAG